LEGVGQDSGWHWRKAVKKAREAVTSKVSAIITNRIRTVPEVLGAWALVGPCRVWREAQR